MTIEIAKQNVGNPFKFALCDKWDVIKEVKEDGTIIGEFIEANCEDCRLKLPQPEHLKKTEK